jgi:hypothetical protein
VGLPGFEPGLKESESDAIVKEFLEACSLLYPKHKRACALLLKEASNKILEV